MSDLELLGSLGMIAAIGYACTYLTDDQFRALVKVSVAVGLVLIAIGTAIIAIPIFVVVIVVAIIVGAACSRK